MPEQPRDVRLFCSPEHVHLCFRCPPCRSGAVWLFSMTWRVIAGTPGPAAAGASGAKEAPQEPTLSPEDWERHFREQQAQRGRAAHAQPQPQHRRQSPPPPPAAEAAAGPSDSAPWGAASEEFDAAGSFARRQQAASAPSSVRLPPCLLPRTGRFLSRYPTPSTVVGRFRD